jgi:2Fe-2S ferredoxin
MTRIASAADMSASAIVRVEPLGRTIETRQGEPLMRAARRAGLRWPTICNGVALCGTCHCRVLAHSQPLAPPSAKELAGLVLVPPHMQGPTTRLACQFVPSGDVTVERVGVQLAEPDLSKGSAND